jgi:GPH family glycoside/pentoside/hexuronide:cation symporter
MRKTAIAFNPCGDITLARHKGQQLLFEICSKMSGPIGFGFLLVTAYAMFTDIAEYVDWRTRLQMTGLVISASIFAVKAGIALGSSIPGFVLGITGFVPRGAQSDAARLGIELAFGIIPAIALIPAAIAMLFYRLDRATITKIERDLAQRRGGAELLPPKLV